MDHEHFIDSVISYHKENNWKKIIELGENNKSEDVRKILWVWPSETNLKFIKNCVGKFKLKGITSIGCGSGLLEWLIQQYTNLSVVGYEVNHEWWSSKYSCTQFIPLQFPQLPPGNDCLNTKHALLFCYFNNGPAFLEYIRVYQGNLIFIVGPGEGRGTHTNPDPFQPGLSDQWKLYDYQEVRNTKDFIAVYVKLT